MFKWCGLKCSHQPQDRVVITPGPASASRPRRTIVRLVFRFTGESFFPGPTPLSRSLIFHTSSMHLASTGWLGSGRVWEQTQTVGTFPRVNSRDRPPINLIRYLGFFPLSSPLLGKHSLIIDIHVLYWFQVRAGPNGWFCEWENGSLHDNVGGPAGEYIIIEEDNQTGSSLR